ncbi:MAG: diguanylate cyclase [Betaproteobacteria bacterium]|nr:diguanylate cyclase [Betaproteobacteria bacterium]
MSSKLAHIVWHRLTGLMPGELNKAELTWLLSPHFHLTLLSRRRATMIVNRVRLFSFLFAVLTPLWSIIDYVVFPFPLWFALAAMRFLASAAFAFLVVYYRPSGSLPDAYRAMAIMFAIPTMFYIASHQLLVSHQLTGMQAAIGAGYAFLPFVLLAGLSIFPLTLAENILFALPMLLAQAVSGIISWATLDWPSFAGAFWLLALITGVSTLAGLSQLAFMIALVRQAIRDPLTGIFSRRSGEEVLELQFIISSRSNAPMSLAFVDLDNFKSINDRYGHEAGDEVLVAATEAISTNLRRGDMIARWGGEEFILIMPNTDLEQAQQAMRRLRQAGFGLRPDGNPVTASVGLAERIEDRALDWKTLVEKSDQRMYRAKQSGRDRVIAEDEQ